MTTQVPAITCDKGRSPLVHRLKHLLETDPFVVPTDQELFRSIVESRTLNKRSNAFGEQYNVNGKIHEKSTLASRMQATFSNTHMCNSTLNAEEEKLDLT